MMKVQRQFGKMLPRTADEAQVSVLLKDFEDADKMLAKIIDASKAWRDAWLAILDSQHNLAGEFLGLYQPIAGAGETHDGHDAVETPEDTMDRTDRLVNAYGELKTELQEEVNMVNSMIVGPATDAKVRRVCGRIRSLLNRSIGVNTANEEGHQEKARSKGKVVPWHLLRDPDLRSSTLKDTKAVWIPRKRSSRDQTGTMLLWQSRRRTLHEREK
jgi:hypothetical protein